MKHVLVLGKIHPAGIERLNAASGVTVEEAPDNPPRLLERLATTDAIVVRSTRIGPEVVAAAPKLAIVARVGVGYDTVDVAALTKRRIPLALVGDVNSDAVAEHVLALMLGLAHRLTLHDRATREGHFAIRDTFSTTELAEKTVLVIGYGRIGRQVARRCAAFDMRVLAADPAVAVAAVAADGYRQVSDFRTALGEADFVTIHVPRGPDTEIGRAHV